MSSDSFYFLVYIWIAVAIVLFPFILWVAAPYGRHTKKSWGPLIDNKLGWILMESPALFVFSYFFLTGKGHATVVPWIFFGFWVFHYINRTLIFPFRLQTKGKKMPVAIVLMAFCFNLMNGYVNGYYLGNLASNDISWLMDPRFIIGACLFITGMYFNWSSDTILIHLRKPGETGYVIPKGGLFNAISCPNHFSEMVEWAGFAIMTWSIPGLSFFIWTFVNLLPRAIHHHKWYKQTFPEYPKDRKAVIPYLL